MAGIKLEVRIPISPEPHFFRQVEYIVRSFALNGGRAADARFAVFVGADCEPYDLYSLLPWSRGVVEWNWVDRKRFQQLSFFATGTARFLHPTEADVVLMLDADTLLINPIDDLLETLVLQPAIAGVMTHIPPFMGMSPPQSWETVFSALGRQLPRDRYQHTGWSTMYSDPALRFGPAYFNLGAVFVPGKFIAVLGPEFERQMSIATGAPVVRAFAGQLALCLAIYERDIPRVAIDIRHNFPNDEWADRIFLNDLADVRIIHYLREHVIGGRRATWSSDEALTAFVKRRDLTGSNEVLRRSVLSVSSIRMSPASEA